MNNEIWKDVCGFEGYYQVSNLGNVKRISHQSNSKKLSERNKTLGTDKDGYKTVMLYMGTNTRKLCKVHRLVAEAFIPNSNNLPMVNHKDEKKDNNSVENLEWCDCIYNNNYGTRNSRLSKSKKGHPCYSVKSNITGRFIKKGEN